MNHPTSLVLACAALLAGCTATLASTDLAPAAVEVTHQHPVRVAVEANDSPGSFLSAPRIPAQELVSAVRQAIATHEVFRLAAEHAEAPRDYTLRAEVLQLDESDLALDRSCELIIRWTLLASPTDEVVWTRDLTTDHTSHTYNSDPSDDRILVAITEAARSNIARALKALSKLELDPR